MLLTLYDQTGSVKATLSPNDTSTQDKEIQGDNVLSLSFTLYEYVGIDVNDYVDFEGERYWAVEKYLPNEKSTVEWEYNVKLYGIESLIKRFLVLKTVDGENEAVFTLTARPIDHMRLIVQSINSGMNTSDWKVGTVEGTDNVVIDYFGKYCDEGLKELAEKVGAEWWIEGETVNLCRCEHGEELTLAYGAGLTSLDRDVADNAKFYTRLFPIGSSRNIDPERYGASRLQLPGGVKYVDVNAERYGVIHHYEQEAFSGIYPRRVGVVSSVRSENVQDSDGNPFTIYYFKDDNLTFDPNDYEIGGLVKHVSFQEGSELAGLGADEDHYFEVNYNSETREFEIITIWPYDDDTQLPGGTLVPKVGDRYILWNIRMPDEYYGLAEQEFESAVNEYNSKHALDVSCYKAPTDHVWIEDEDVELYIGRRIRLVSQEYFPDTGYRASRITKIIRHVTLPSQMDLEISDALSTRSLEKIDDAINGVRNYTRTQVNSINLPDVIKSWEGTEPTDNNLYSARASHRHFLNKRIADKALEVITFVKGVLFGDGSHGITEDGDASLRDIRMQSTQSEGYSGTDIITDKGFKVWEDSEGKSHLITDYFSARVKAFFASLEIRKIEHSAGNRIESPAGNTLALVKKYGIDSHGDPYEIVDKWYARRYTFAGVSFGMPKLVYQVANYFGVWKEDPSATVAFYRCYWTAEDKEDKKAVENNWRVGDQAFCETFNLRVPQGSGFASNKRYWRLVVGTGYETIEGVEYAYIDLSNEETLYLEASKIDTPIDAQVVSGLIACSGYDTGSDRPEAGDDVACLGNQVSWTTRGGAKQTITYDPNPSTSGVIVPCVKMYAGINSFSALDNFRFKKESPSGIYVHSDKFQIVSAAGTGASSPIYCQRGTYSTTETYGKNDIVQYHGASWLYINDTPSSGHAPAEGEYWTAFAQRGMGTPQVELDSVNAVVSANYEGKISNISQVTGLPTTVEVYVDGKQIPVAKWNLANSYVNYAGNNCPMSGLFVIGTGVVLTNITANTNDVALTWAYRTEERFDPETGLIRRIHPVINPTDIKVHVEFAYNGETYSADTGIPMIVQKAAASVLAQYSADGITWENAFKESHGHIYVRYSYDGGTTWTDKIRIVGKSIEFERGVAHYESWDDLNDYISDTPSPVVGYYLCDEDDSGNPLATLWHFDGSRMAQVAILNEVNYLAKDADNNEDGHLWNADGSSSAWADMGVIQGADGIDGISVTLDPATVIFEQDEDNTSTFTPSPSSFTATVNVWKGTTPLASNSYKVAIQSTTNCTATTSGNQITSLTLGQVSQGVYFSSGSVVLGVWLDPTSTSQTPDTTLTFNWAANLLGTWKASVVNDAYTSVSSKPIAIINSNGEIETKTFETIFQQTAEYIMLDVDGFAGKTGIDLEDGTITLKANKVTFTNSSGTVSDKISIDSNTGTLRAVDGVFEGKITAKNYLVEYADLITFCYDKDGMTGLFIPGDENYQTMYDDSDYSTANSIDVSNSWYFMVTETEVRLPNYINLVGQQVTIYNPTIGGSAAAKKTVIRAGDTLGGGDIIRGVGLSWDTKNFEPVPIESYRPVREIEFCDGLIQLQCVPSTTPNHYEWCVVNIGTNVVKIREKL